MTSIDASTYQQRMTEAQIIHIKFGIIMEANMDAGGVLVPPSGVASRRERSIGVTTLSPKFRSDKFTDVPGRIKVECASCGRDLFIVPFRIATSKTGRHFCDTTCQSSFRQPIEELFASNLVKLDCGCWRYRGGETKHGYRNVNMTARGLGWIGAHRLSYQIHKGGIPEGLVIDHLCRNRWCVNPDHLEAVSHEENVRRAVGETCTNGHPKTPENTLYRKNGRVHTCRICRAERAGSRS